MPPLIKKCLATWRKYLPDYELHRWDETNVDVESVPFVREAYKAKKWAFVADYVRLHALYAEGGIYMDTDVKVCRSFDEFLKYDFFSSHEKHPSFFAPEEQAKLNEDKTLKNPETFVKGFGVLSAVMGAAKGCQYIKDCLDHYNTLTFKAEHTTELVIGGHITRQLLKYGYRFEDVEQDLAENMKVMTSHVFVGNMIYMDKRPYAIHLCNGSWTDSAGSTTWWLRNHFPALERVLSLALRAKNKMLRLLGVKK